MQYGPRHVVARRRLQFNTRGVNVVRTEQSVADAAAQGQ
jgi:hypothetical protein